MPSVEFKQRTRVNFYYCVPQDPNYDELATAQTLPCSANKSSKAILLFKDTPAKDSAVVCSSLRASATQQAKQLTVWVKFRKNYEPSGAQVNRLCGLHRVSH